MRDAQLTAPLAARIEDAETQAWRSMGQAVPAEFAARTGLQQDERAGLLLTRCPGIAFVHFNCVHGLGVQEPASEPTIEAIFGYYYRAWFVVHHTPWSRPADLAHRLEAHGLRPQGGWDRIVRDDAPLTPPPSDVEPVTAAIAPAWAAFIDRVYGLRTAPWLEALVGHPGWFHALLREKGEIVAARSMFLGPTGDAWLGIDAPVPGLMSERHDRDLAVSAWLVAEGLAHGARLFATDIERTDPARGTPAYGGYAELGFEWAYRRTLYS